MKLIEKYNILEFVVALQIIVAILLACMFLHTSNLLNEAEYVGETLLTACDINESLISEQRCLIEELKEKCETVKLDTRNSAQLATLSK